jgi:hypothetical protein
MEITEATKNKVYEALTSDFSSIGEISTKARVNYYTTMEALMQLVHENKAEKTTIYTKRRDTLKYKKIPLTTELNTPGSPTNQSIGEINGI